MLNAKEWAKLWASLTEEEKEAVLTMKRRAIQWREQEFYEAKFKKALKEDER